jgi:sugar phosphate isomerase/epimerase
MNHHPRVSVNSLCSFSLSLAEDVMLWKELGIDHAGLFLGTVEEMGMEDATRLLKSTNIRVSTVAGPLPIALHTPEDSDARRLERVRISRALDLAAETAAGSVYLCTGSSGGCSWDEAVERFDVAIDPVRRHADALGVRLAIEATSPLRADASFVFTLRDAVDLARATGVGVCLDLQTCWYERDVGQTIAAGMDLIELIQVSDYVLGTFSTGDRAVPGDGTVPIKALLEVALNLGYGGNFDLEVLGPRVEQEGYASAIRRSVEWVSAVLDDLGA